jgi:hypothetical protein
MHVLIYQHGQKDQPRVVLTNAQNRKLLAILTEAARILTRPDSDYAYGDKESSSPLQLPLTVIRLCEENVIPEISELAAGPILSAFCTDVETFPGGSKFNDGKAVA